MLEESAPKKKVKSTLSVNKVMAGTFWNAKIILLLITWKKVKVHWREIRNFTATFQQRGKEKMYLFGKKKEVLLPHDNAPANR